MNKCVLVSRNKIKNKHVKVHKNQENVLNSVNIICIFKKFVHQNTSTFFSICA